MKDHVVVQSSALPSATRVAGFHATEGISRPYEIELVLFVGAEGQDLDFTDVVGARARLAIEHDDGRPPFAFHGIFASFELLHELDERTLFRAILVPRLWLLTTTRHSRIFTDRSIPEILSEVLTDSGFSPEDYDLRLTGSYAPEEHVCQYQESNFDFISRWMEREGMYYYFEQGERGERLVIADGRAVHGRLDDRTVQFYAGGSGEGRQHEALHTFTCKHQVLPGSVRVRDYDYARPTLDVSGSAPVSKGAGGEVSVHGGRFFSPEEGQRIARVRAEELRARQVVYRGSGSALYLRAGYLFKLGDHPRAAFDAEYLVIAAEHHCNQALSTPELRALTGIERTEAYRVEIEAIPATVQFRPESRTAWPRIYGSENGTICGPAESEYAQIDETGRYRVKFKFDESDLGDGKASTWVRMMQPHGGGVEGFHFPLRKGTEVIFTFLGGDPDRPVIAGVVPNTHTPSPVTSGNHTQNVIQTGGRNRIELEDAEGREHITLRTPWANTWLSLGAPYNPTAGVSVNTTSSLTVNANATATLTIGGATASLFIGAKQSTTIGASDTLNVGATHTLNVVASATETIGPTSMFTTGPSISVNVGPKITKDLFSASESQTKVKESTNDINTPKLKVIRPGLMVIS
ncbi:MAG: type VI secretion system tip protein TssI/VgrG [Minicystis sp.]